MRHAAIITGNAPKHRAGNKRLGSFDHGCQCGLYEGRFWFWFRLHNGDLRQRFCQLVRCVGSQKLTACFVCDTLHLGQSFGVRADIKPDHMGGEIYPGFFEQARGRAWIGIAGFNAIAHQYDGGFFLGVAQSLGCCDDGIGHRRFAQRFDGIHRIGDLAGRARGRGHNSFDIRAFPAFAVAVDRQAKPLFCWEVVKQCTDNILCNRDLCSSVDLAPHGAGAVHHQNRIWLILRCGKCRSKGQ